MYILRGKEEKRMNGKRLQELREINGYTRDEVAERVLVTEMIVQGWEQGWGSINPSSGEIEEMAEMFNMTEEELRFEIEQEEEDDYDYSSNSSGYSFSETVGSAVGSLLYLKMLEEERKKEIKREKIKAFCKKHWKAISVSCLALAWIILIVLICNYNKKLTPIGYDSDDLIGMKYKDAVRLLEDEGFTNIKIEEEKTLNYKDIEKENLVYSIKIGVVKEFDDDEEFAYDDKIVITYRTLELLTVPLSSKEAKGMNYKDVEKEFKDAGFVNIEYDIEYDIVTGWLTNVGEVEKVIIEDDKKVKKNDEYRADTTIIIKYHAKKKDKPK